MAAMICKRPPHRGQYFDIDIEHPFEQARPTPARRRALRVRVIGCVLGCLLRWTRNDRSAQLDVGASTSYGSISYPFPP